MMEKDILSDIHWLGHASFRIDAGPTTIYLDPWQLGQFPKPADLILITHDHGDHCSPDDIKKIQVEDTVIVTVKDAGKNLRGDIRIVKPGDSISIKDLLIEVVPAYNLTKFRSPGIPFHPKEKGYAGFIIEIQGQRIYHSGDSDLIPEMSEISVNIAMLPVSGTYVMTSDEALEAVKIIDPDIVIPMHVGRGIGSEDDIRNFRSRATVPVAQLDLEN